MNAIALYGRYVATSLRAQAQYPTATLMLTAGHCAATAIEILCVFALFHRFGSVGGWTLVLIGLGRLAMEGMMRRLEMQGG